jgi:ubiquinone/menaquinone biosynthesis C-methylase UbiE
MHTSRVTSADHRAAIAAIFDEAANDYDHVGVEFFKRIAKRLVTELAPQPGERSLDIGCGRGEALFELARAVGPHGRAVGVDLAPRMVAATAEDAAAAGLDVEVRVGDAQAPNIDDADFDVIAASLVLFFLPDPIGALAAWRSLLVHGGRVGVSTFGEYTTPAWDAVDNVFVPYLADQGPDGNAGSSENPFSSDTGMEHLLVEAGFSDVRSALTTVQVRFDDHDHWYRWTLSHGQRRRWQAVPAEQRTTVVAAAYEALDGCRDQQGRIGFDQIVRYTLGHR